MKCPKCGVEMYALEGFHFDADNIRDARFCSCCHIIYEVHAGGIQEYKGEKEEIYKVLDDAGFMIQPNHNQRDAFEEMNDTVSVDRGQLMRLIKAVSKVAILIYGTESAKTPEELLEFLHCKKDNTLPFLNRENDDTE